MKKRLISTLLIIIMAVSTIMPVKSMSKSQSDDSATIPFSDVSETDWFYNAVKTIYDNKIMEGKTDVIFAPAEGTTRAQIVTIFYRLAGANEKGLGKKLTFTDTTQNAWYSDYLGWATQENLINGYPEGDFRPDKEITRQELAKLIVEFQKYLLADVKLDNVIDKFNDNDSFPDWSESYIEECRICGIFVGDQNGNFNPGTPITRAEIATIIERILPSINEALAPLPPTMGWSSWNCFQFSNINETNIIAQMDAIIEKGLYDVGYQYVNIDDGWMNGRDEVTERVKYHEEKFPNGMKYIADEAHKRGLKAGLYTDIGKNTCASGDNTVDFNGIGVGLYNHAEDLWMYLGDGIYNDAYARTTGEKGVECWGFDYIKVDSNGTKENLQQTPEQLHNEYYNYVKDIEKSTGKDKIYNMCRWFYEGPYQLRIGDSWRSSIDLGCSFKYISNAIEKQKRVGKYTIPGHYGDVDMLQVGNGMSAAEDRTHFAMWCMFASPLVLGCDLRYINDETLELVKNTELIAINQDKLGRSAAYIKTYGNSTELWFKKTVDKGDGNGAIALYNKGDSEETITINLSDICTSGSAEMRDVFAHSDLGEKSNYTVTIAPHDTVVFTINTDKGYIKDCYEVYGEVDIEYDIDIIAEYGINVEQDTINAETAKKYLSSPLYKAMLIDVRTPDEYVSEHLDGAVNVEYKRLVESTDILPASQEPFIIVYSSDEKRAVQAYYELKILRYHNVFILDDMNSY